MKLEVYDETQHREMLETFFDATQIENNKDVNALGIEKRKNVMLNLVIHNDKIVNMSYAHDFSDYYPNTYRIFTRTATLEGYRGVGFPRSRTMISAAGLAIWNARTQIEFALFHGAKDVLFTSNHDDGMISSRRLGKYLEKIEAHDPRFSYFDQREIYGCNQKVWRANFRDLVNAKGQI